MKEEMKYFQARGITNTGANSGRFPMKVSEDFSDEVKTIIKVGEGEILLNQDFSFVGEVSADIYNRMLEFALK